MRPQRLNSPTLKLAFAAVALVALAAVACNGNDSSSVGGSPSPGASPSATATYVPPTPGTGTTPADALATYFDVKGLDGHKLDSSKKPDCPLEGVPTIPSETPAFIWSRISLGQFCVAAKDYVADKAITEIVDLPDTGEVWVIKLEFDADAELWKIKDINKVSG